MGYLSRCFCDVHFFVTENIRARKGDIIAFTCKLYAPWQKSWIISDGVKRQTSGGLEITLDRFNMRLRSLLNTCAFGYLLRVRKEDFDRLHLRCKFEKNSED